MPEPSTPLLDAQRWSKRSADYASSPAHTSGPSLPKLLQLLRPLATDTCLDIGTGAGHTAALLAKHTRYVYGLDPAEGMRHTASHTYAHLSNLEFVDGTSEKTGFPDDTFDIVTARHTLHHHPSIPKTLREVTRVLKPGGRLVIVDEVTPNEVVNEWYDVLERTRDRTHLRAYYMSEWQRFIKRSGLMWVVGDSLTVYTLDVPSWIARMRLPDEQASAVRALFRDAPEAARQTFNIAYHQGEAVSFDMPMAIILAVKPA